MYKLLRSAGVGAEGLPAAIINKEELDRLWAFRILGSDTFRRHLGSVLTHWKNTEANHAIIKNGGECMRANVNDVQANFGQG